MATKTKVKTEEDGIAEVTEQIVELRNEGGKWEEIAATVGLSTGKTMLLYMQATVRPKDRIKGKTDEELAAAIVSARDEDQLSWGQIMVRSGLPETRCRKIYEETTGTSTRGNRIGKGGRYPDGVTPPARASEPKEKAVKKAAAKKAPAAKAPATKAPAKKAPAKSAGSKLAAMSDTELSSHIMGKTITYKNAGQQFKVKVADVLDYTGEGADAEVTVENTDGNQAIITVGSIVRVAAR